MTPHTVIAQSDDVDAVREAAGDLFGDGLALESGGRAWDCPLVSEEVERLREAGAVVEERGGGSMRAIVERHGEEIVDEDPEAI